MHEEEREVTGYPSIDQPWLKYYGSNPTPNLSQTVYQVVYERNRDHLTDIALEYFGRKITYQELFQQVEAAKAAFEEAGVRKGERIVFFTSSCPEIIYGVLALCRIGAVANMVNPLFEPEQIKSRIAETDAKLIVVMDALYGKLCEAMEWDDTTKVAQKVIVVPVAASMPLITKWAMKVKGQAVISYSQTVVSWNKFVRGRQEAQLPDEKYEAERAFIMVYSSGSTGAAKGIVLTNGGMCATISHYLSPSFPCQRGDRYLQIVPIWFSTGIVLSVLMPLCVGITVVIEPVFSKENFAADLIKYRPNITLGATSLWLYTMKSRKLKYKDLSFLKYPITGGEQMLGRVETAVNAFLKEHGCRSSLIKGYGMCELGSTISTDDREHQKQDAAGFPITGVVVAAFDTETNQELPYNKHGELRVISPAHMKEYFKNPVATAEFFWADMEGRIWGRTGDIGYVDEDGFVHVLGRASDQFTAASGRKHYCFDIENVILQEPNVAQCEVVGLSQGSGEIPVAHLILEEDTKVDTMELLKKIHELCAHTLDEECVPYGYRICGEFPVKNTGKRDMGKLKTIREGFFVPSAGWVTNI